MPDLLLRGGRPWGVNAPADVLIRDRVIERIGSRTCGQIRLPRW